MLISISTIYSNNSKVQLCKSKLNQIGVVLEMHSLQMLEVRIQLKDSGKRAKLVQQSSLHKKSKHLLEGIKHMDKRKLKKIVSN